MEKWMCNCIIAVKMMICIYIRLSSDVCIPLDMIPLSKSVYCTSYVDISYITFQFVLMSYLVLYLEGTLAISRASFMIQCIHYTHASFLNEMSFCVCHVCVQDQRWNVDLVRFWIFVDFWRTSIVVGAQDQGRCVAGINLQGIGDRDERQLCWGGLLYTNFYTRHVLYMYNVNIYKFISTRMQMWT